MRKNGLLRQIESADIEKFRPVVFWSINSELDEGELCRQIREMKSFGLGGFIFHARAGLTTEYLSEEWFHYAGVCLDEAKRLGMRVWLYDEFGWPSGFAGGKLLRDKENLARYIEYKVLDYFDAGAYAVYEVSDGKALRINGNAHSDKYHTLYVRYSDAYADILNPDVTDKFIFATHEEYYKRFGTRFGRELAGFFTDEPQYYRYATPISAVTEREYARAYGEDLKEELLYLFLQSDKGYPFRVKYYNLMSKLYCTNFYGKLYDWCDSRGCMLTGHSVEETFFFTQMWGGADCAASYMYEHVPAIDNLARTSPAVISAKSAGSVAAQTDKKLVMTETFGCSGYGVTPRELRLIAEKQYVHGVNLMCQHLYNYSLAGQGKIDHPISFGRTLPWIKGYKTFNDYFARLGYLIADSKEQAYTAVVTPMESVYLDYMRLDERAARENTDREFINIADDLRRQNIAYHFVNEKVLESIGSTEGGRLTVGACTYEAVVLANCRELKSGTVKLLRKFSADGGKLAVAGTEPRYTDGVKSDLSDLKGNISLEELPRPVRFNSDYAIDFTCRTIGDKRFVFAVNESDREVNVTTEDDFSAVDLVRLEGYAPRKNFTVPPGSSLLLEESGEYTESQFEPVSAEEIIPVFEGSDPNSLTLENASVILENGERLNGYVYGIFETLIKRGYRGKITAEFTFESDCEREIVLTAERMHVYDVRFNGETAAFACDESDVNFVTVKLTARKGENVYSYRADFTDGERIGKVLFGTGVPESLRNCLTYSTLLEPVYVSGRFDTCGFALTAPRAKTAGNLTARGLCNFCGMAEYSLKIKSASNTVRLTPIGDYAMCEFICGDNTATALMNGSAVLKLPGVGEHGIRVKCYGTMRNKFGPFHCASGGEDAVSPDCFTLRGGWSDERTNPDYCRERKSIPFGLSSVRVQYAK